MQSIDPATGKLIRDYEPHSSKEVEEKIDSVYKAFNNSNTSAYEVREEKFRKLGSIIGDKKEDLSELMTLEMGKPITQSISEIEKCAWLCDYYSTHGRKFLMDEERSTDALKSYVSYRPLGVVLAVMPWNFPFWQVFRFAVPGLLAGNTALLKHASNVPGCALKLEELFSEAGFENSFKTLLISSENVEGIIKDIRIAAVTLTGSTAAGASVGSTAGSQIKKCVLELGGSDPYLILKSANIKKAAEKCAESRMINNGQSCIAAKRFIVVEDVYEEWLSLFRLKMESYEMQDPIEQDCRLGPMASAQLRDDLHEQIKRSVKEGATILTGGKMPDREGAWYPPTILTDVSEGVPAYSEELFGPVATVINVKHEEEAIRIANDTSFGLGAAVFTKDISLGEQIARNRLNAGACFVNELVRSDPRLPFGGIKNSGYGRELSREGIREFVNTKTVYIQS